MSDDAMFIDGLAGRLYVEHKRWAEEALGDDAPHVRWFALREDLKQPYLDAAKAMIQAERERRS